MHPHGTHDARRRRAVTLLACLLGAAAIGLPAPAAMEEEAAGRPRLVVIVIVDQLRADYLGRFTDLFLPARRKGQVGGFRYLMESGAYHLDAHHDHYPLYTGPGHAALLTGAPPYKNGIVSNAWFDRSWKRMRNCVEDPEHPQVGGLREGRPVSPFSLLSTTVGDELKVATGGRAKVWSLAHKDRAAVFMGGHLADGVLWDERATGRWVSSTFFARDGKLPSWVEAWNSEKRADAWFGRVWDLSVPREALARVWPPGAGSALPRRIDGGESSPGSGYYRALVASPFGIEHVLSLAREVIRRESLGADEIPDLLAVGLSGNDYVGHDYGPDSVEVLDLTVRTDSLLASFFNWIQGNVPGGLEHVTLVVSSDHGVAPVVKPAVAAGLPGGFYDEEAAEAAAEAALDGAFGEDRWIQGSTGIELYLDRETLERRKIAPAMAEKVAAGAIEILDGYYAVYTRSQILEGRLPETDLARRIARSFHPANSGDLVLVPEISWLPSGSAGGTTHGRPYTYDTAVPLLLGGFGIRPGVHAGRVSTLDLAPTLSALLGILPPSGCEGRILGHALAAVAAPGG